ncbi:MAG: inorganic diphosphatase [Candidatus Pacebacteria bacterium]|nr:inorganic diphosphatase [Candidatus Paceibacterota bacterium]
MNYKKIPFGDIDKFNVLVEVPKGSENKYEYDEELGAIALEWVFTGGFCFPYNYGFIPETLGGDGDNLDAFVITSHPIPLGIIAKCRAIGIIELLDRGKKDNKIISVPVIDKEYKNCENLSELPFDYKTIFEKLYKELAIQKNKIIEIKGFWDKSQAIEEIEKARKNFK